MNLKDIDIDVLAFFFPEFGYLRDFIFGFVFESQPTTILIYRGLVCEIKNKKEKKKKKKKVLHRTLSLSGLCFVFICSVLTCP